jgi:protein-S-isoprenylcysteine O-methyltransferase Ste14
MQAGIILSTVFASNLFSIDRLIFIGIMVTGIVIGVMREEKRMEEQFVGYPKYKQQVKYRFIPFLC